jgi:hypothetical protein
MSGWTAEDLAGHYKRLREPTPDLTEDEPKPTGRYVITSAPRTKKNSLRRMKRGNRVLSVPSAAYCEWHKRAVPQAYQIKDEMRRAGIETPITDRVTVSAVIYQDANRRADECGYMQALGDWLQDVGIVENDVLIHWNGVDIAVDRERPRIEFEVKL